MPKTGIFSASEIHRLLADGQVDFNPDREGGKGCYYASGFETEQFATVAEFTDFVKAKRKELGKFTLSTGAKTYAEEKAMELLFRDDPEGEPDFQNAETRRGNMREVEGLALFEMQYDIELWNTGEQQSFIVSSCGLYGATPDGLHGIIPVEIKSPKRIHHLSNMRLVTDYESLKAAHPAYAAQVQCQMSVTGADLAYWMSYNPAAHHYKNRLHVVEIKRNQSDIDYMIAKIRLAAEYRDSIVAKFQ